MTQAQFIKELCRALCVASFGGFGSFGAFGV
jgi:hypothetical protein